MRIRRAHIQLPLAVVAAAAAPAPADALVHPGFAAARLTGCVTAIDQADRSASFEAELRTIRGASRLMMKFTLQARSNGQTHWMRVSGPRLDQWVMSDPGKKGYVYDKRVDNLLAPADYRVVVHFRWVDAAGRVIASARRHSRSCRQPDSRPDLRIGDVRVHLGSTPSTRRYVAVIRNAGQTAAGPFVVTFTPQGGAQQAREVGGLLAGEQVALDFEAPACAPGSSFVLTVDADQQVDEAFEADDTVTVSCPA